MHCKVSMKDTLHLRCVIQENARRINQMHERIHETFARRSEGREAWEAWRCACAEFRQEYEALAFPGGFESGLKRLEVGEERAIEEALAFVEVRPYFFRSQYMHQKLVPRLKRAVLSSRQAERFQAVMERLRRQGWG